MFLFTVLLTFLVFGFTGGADIGGANTDPARAAETLKELRAGYAKAKADTKIEPEDPKALEAGVRIAESAVATCKVSGADVIDEVSQLSNNSKLNIEAGDASLDDKVRKAFEEPAFFLYKL